MMSSFCYLVGRWSDEEEKLWDVQGVYDIKSEAENNSRVDWFVMEIEKNTPLPFESTTTGYYPKGVSVNDNKN